MAGFSMIEFFKLGGIFMWPLLLFSIIGLGYVMERCYVYLNIDFKKHPELDGLIDKIRDKETVSIPGFASAKKKNIIAEVIQSGLEMIGYKIDEVEKVMESTIKMKVQMLEKGLNVLMVLSNLAPLVGFLGTVSGMINAFKSIALAEEVSTQLVAGGIYEALITTVVGLVIAIMVQIAYNIFIQKVDNFVSESEQLSNRLIKTLIKNRVD